MSGNGFASAEVARAWPYIRRSVDRIVGRCCEAPGGQIHWTPPADNANSVAALATHAMGSLEHRLLGLLCGQDRQRDRECEFGAARVSAEEIVQRWGLLCAELEAALSQLTDEQVDSSFEHPDRGAITGHDILLIAARHMAEHEGQAQLTFDLAVAAKSRDVVPAANAGRES